MTQDQLHKARQTRWRQDGNALLTLDDTERWLADTPLCLYLPRRQHLPVPAPSFVEAIAGRPDPTAAPAQIAAASQMLARLVVSGAVIALNLFGSASGIAGEQPDFLATPEALPYLYALQSQRNPKKPPSTSGAARVSPLAVEAFHILTREGALTAIELRERLGREVTEAATLRALGELWHAMRVVPVPDEHGASAHWELLSARHSRELNIGSTQSQTTALSILVSFYLQSAIAASAEQAEIFLSPLASRSRIRDVIHGLSATRQLASFSLKGEEQLYVEGTLPEIVEEEKIVTDNEANTVTPSLDAGLEQNEPSFAEAAAPAPPSPRSRPRFADRARGRFTPRPRDEQQRERQQRSEGGFRRPERHGPRTDSHPRRDREGRPREERPRFTRGTRPPVRIDREDRPRPAARPDRGTRPAARIDRESAPKRDFDKRDFEKRESGRPNRGGFEKRKPNFDRGDRFQKRGPSQSQRTFQPAGAKPAGSFNRGPNRPFREQNERRPFQKNRLDRPFQKREGNRFEKRPRQEGERQGTERSDRHFAKRAGDRFEKRPRREGERPYAASGQRPPRRGPAFRPTERREGERPDRPFRPKPAGGERRPFRREGERRDRPAGFQKPAGRERGYSKPQGHSGSFKPRPQNAGSGPDFRKGFNKPRPFDSGRPDNRPFGKSTFRPGKPGGARPFEGNAKRFPGKRPEGNRPGGFTSRPRRNKPRRESGEGDEG